MAAKASSKGIKPILKWAGGKTQLLDELMPRIPDGYGKYIEPFFGGGALFFALRPESAVIADSNPEIINMYEQVASNVEKVIERLKGYKNEKNAYYAVRDQSWEDLPKFEAAARTLYLNHTCYNGLYRVNKSGKFNTPFGGYKKPNICNETALRAASEALRKAIIVCGDYQDVLREYAAEGDFVFLDPPYLPVTPSGDFKRYTKEQFHEDDHRVLAETIKDLEERGCRVVLTNSNHPVVMELYRGYPMTIVQTRRHVSCRGDSRSGEDVIVDIGEPKVKTDVCQQVDKYPQTRYMGSKQKMLGPIGEVVKRFGPSTAIDLFAGSGIVSYMLKALGIQVLSNDYMWMSSTFTKALVENNDTILGKEASLHLLKPSDDNDHFVATKFKGLYYEDEENETIDTLRANIKKIENEHKRAIATMALIRACMKKRPRGIFTYTGHRYDDGRKDLRKSVEEQFVEAVELIDRAVFDNGRQNVSVNGDALELDAQTPDLVYIDPPYYSKNSDNEYVRRYHFVEGLARDWDGVEIQEHTKTKKFKSYPTPFSTELGAEGAFEAMFDKYSDSVIVVSYSSNCLPDRERMIELLARHKKHVEVIPIDYTYGFGNQASAKTHRNRVKEYLFIGY
ncbi:Dam family site-specific DNA-(adenine-N6)-methyltransferase [Adlercreutzia caecimuris]|uniref:Site-specific DNA-methyltransferase (adenine-specific) n=1 Tax=Adlercreutzia caecimuris B7 TaxID=1235794 RepID=R9L535_9ACTN|nr:Dam family site-specific DNA-(adenine-N6)-methyltransferase [Adlercreutzia caecimuris]EOS50857.1 DNA adenine methylase [Adlercreutzia caecimuris B7]